MLEMDIKADGDFICDVFDVVEAMNGEGGQITSQNASACV